MDAEELKFRLSIARAHGRFRSQSELSMAIDATGLGLRLGVDTLSSIESGKRRLLPHEANVIAELCGVPERYLTDELFDPFSEQAEERDERLVVIEEQLLDVQSKLDKLATAVGALAELQPRPRERSGQLRHERKAG